jgi:hypothetical protein
MAWMACSLICLVCLVCSIVGLDSVERVAYIGIWGRLLYIGSLFMQQFTSLSDFTVSSLLDLTLDVQRTLYRWTLSIEPVLTIRYGLSWSCLVLSLLSSLSASPDIVLHNNRRCILPSSVYTAAGLLSSFSSRKLFYGLERFYNCGPF